MYDLTLAARFGLRHAGNGQLVGGRNWQSFGDLEVIPLGKMWRIWDLYACINETIAMMDIMNGNKMSFIILALFFLVVCCAVLCLCLPMGCVTRIRNKTRKQLERVCVLSSVNSCNVDSAKTDNGSPTSGYPVTSPLQDELPYTFS